MCKPSIGAPAGAGWRLASLRPPPPRAIALYHLALRYAASSAHGGQYRQRAAPIHQGEFDAALEYGVLAHDFLRLRCGARSHEKLRTFSSKRRCFLPSCGARRMSHTAAATGGPCHPAHANAAMHSFAVNPAAPAAGRATRADDATDAFGAAPDHVSAAGPSRAENRRRPWQRPLGRDCAVIWDCCFSVGFLDMMPPMAASFTLQRGKWP